MDDFIHDVVDELEAKSAGTLAHGCTLFEVVLRILRGVGDRFRLEPLSFVLELEYNPVIEDAIGDSNLLTKTSFMKDLDSCLQKTDF